MSAHAPTTSSIADRLAAYARSLSYKNLPPAVVHEVKRRIIDSLGCAFGAWDAAPCRIARQVAQSVKVPDGATLWGTTHKTLPDLAAFANGALVRYLDFNDTYLSKEPAHPSDNLSAIFAAAEIARASGKRVIESIALAYELQCRLCDAAALRPRGWDHVTYGPFSSALAAAKVLKFSAAQTRHAVNLAGVANIALRQTRVGDLSMWKACAFSNAARNGMFAAMLAQQGMTGPAPIFEGEKGFMKLVSGPLDLPALAGEEREPGVAPPFKILETYIKHYPVEYHAQTAVEAALVVREEILKLEGSGAIARITDIEIGSYDVAIEIIGRDQEKWHPQTRETADHSFPYCVAVALMDGTVTLRSFGTRRLRDPALHDLMSRIRVVEQPDFIDWYPQAMPTRVTVRTHAGKAYVKQIDYPLGHPRNPMSDREVEEKFRALSAGRLNRAQAGRVIDLVWKLESLDDVGTLMPLLKVTR
ncbi:MAG TPA: MmgE/PrpD family protein [Nitrospiraceae bacterium]|nr:MmgE/PrpD family protein [Nitrospiraceae bacterium]